MKFIKSSVQKRHFYQILEGNDDYFVALQTQEHLYLIIFKQLFVVDYDDPCKLKILYEFCRLNFTWYKQIKGIMHF